MTADAPLWKITKAERCYFGRPRTLDSGKVKAIKAEGSSIKDIQSALDISRARVYINFSKSDDF